jgi:hypothetical protein
MKSGHDLYFAWRASCRRTRRALKRLRTTRYDDGKLFVLTSLEYNTAQAEELTRGVEMLEAPRGHQYWLRCVKHVEKHTTCEVKNGAR